MPSHGVTRSGAGWPTTSTDWPATSSCAGGPTSTQVTAPTTRTLQPSGVPALTRPDSVTVAMCVGRSRGRRRGRRERRRRQRRQRARWARRSVRGTRPCRSRRTTGKDEPTDAEQQRRAQHGPATHGLLPPARGTCSDTAGTVAAAARFRGDGDRSDVSGGCPRGSASCWRTARAR